MPRGRGRAFDYQEPPERPADPAVRRAYFRRIVALFRPYRRRLAGVLALILFSSALGGIPIRRDRRDLLSVAQAVELLEAGESVALFPQGTVQGGAWTRGAARLALATGTPLVPVRIIGTRRALSRGRIRFSRVRIVVGEPIAVERATPTVAAARALTAELQARVDAAG